MTKILALIPLFLSLLACTSQALPSTALATEVPPTSTLASLPFPTSSPAPVITVPVADGVIYYYFVYHNEAILPTGGVIILPETYILAPTLSDAAPAPEVAVNLKSALEAALSDSRNGWISEKVIVVNVSFSEGHADVELQGEYFGVGDVTLIAASQQILLTVFANTNVQTATVSLNDDTVGNLGVSHSMDAKPADYVFTRGEIEAYLSTHLNASP